MLERMRDPRSPPGVALPAAALRAGVPDFWLALPDEESLTSRRRNCSLFMAVVFAVESGSPSSILRWSRSGLAPDKKAYRLRRNATWNRIHRLKGGAKVSSG